MSKKSNRNRQKAKTNNKHQSKKQPSKKQLSATKLNKTQLNTTQSGKSQTNEEQKSKVEVELICEQQDNCKFVSTCPKLHRVCNANVGCCKRCRDLIWCPVARM